MRLFYPLMFPLLAVLIWATNTVVAKAAAGWWIPPPSHFTAG